MTVLAWLAACRPTGGAPPEAPLPERFEDHADRILLVLLDDVGVDRIGAYAGVPPTRSPTPVIDTLAARGVTFDRAYGYPVCSPARAALLTGRYGRRTGVGDIVQPTEDLELPWSEVTLPEMLTSAPERWASAAIGKWHLVGFRSTDATTHALRQGFDTQRGTLANLVDAVAPDGATLGYHHWERVQDGALALDDRYAPDVSVEDALDFAAGAPTPWFAFVALHLAHAPYQVPPAPLLDHPFAAGAELPQRFEAMVNGADAELGALLAGLGPEALSSTLIVVTGDNGTPGEVLVDAEGADRAKGTVWERGVRVPLIVTGAGVGAEGGRSAALVSLVDLFPTVAEVAGVDLGGSRPLDGTSLVPWLEDPAQPGPRDVLVTERFAPIGPPPHHRDEVSARDASWELVSTRDGDQAEEHLVRLVDGADDGPDALQGTPDPEAAAALERLSAALDAFTALPYDGGFP